MKKGDYFDLEGVSFEDFIKLHQFLEDKGGIFAYSTKARLTTGKFEYEILAYVGGSIQGCGKKNGGLINKLSISDFINQENNYEIY